MTEPNAHPNFNAFKERVLANPEVRAAYEASRERHRREDVEAVLTAHRAIVSGDEDGWHVVCTCGHREPGVNTSPHVAAAICDAMLGEF